MLPSNGLSLLLQQAALPSGPALIALAPAASAAAGLFRDNIHHHHQLQHQSSVHNGQRTQPESAGGGGTTTTPFVAAHSQRALIANANLGTPRRASFLAPAALRRAALGIWAAPRAPLGRGAAGGWHRPVGHDGTSRHASGWRTFATASPPPGPGPGLARPGQGPLGGGGGVSPPGGPSASAGMGWPPSHGPGPGLPLDPTGHVPPLPRPDHLGPGGLADPVNIAADHGGDPRDVIHSLILQSAAGLGGVVPSWGSDQPDGEELRAHQERNQPLASVLNSSAPPSPEQLRRLSGPDLSALAMAVLPTLPPSRVAQLAVALARLSHFDMQYKAVLVEHVVGRMYQFTPQQLADVAWAVAACGYYDLPFLEALAGRLRGTAPQWDARSLAKVLWAFGRFHFVGRDPSVGSEALEAMVERLQDDMDGATVAEVVYAAGQLVGSGVGDWQFNQLQGLVSDFALTSIEAFGPEALGKLASGLNELGVAGVEQELCDVVAARAAQLAPRLEPEDICRVMELLESNGKRNWDDLEALAARAAELSRPPAGRLSPAQAVELVAAFNSVGHVSPSVLALAARSPSMMPSTPGGFVG
ncbi:hypothetical protein PLESTB_000832600 [Pleodorina starrii]|uniref:RNA-editing substrate-binding complex 6 protein domain-containing protein n=1 Tax=Pleodorina starrii TaxID=330485 RepID=A0A9W6BL96_9CHLO|nr:hypothetical protein PLESTB_000832600 [Pleodorina starrii]